MILAVDAGNTRVKAMLAGPKRVVPVLAVETAALMGGPRGVSRWIETAGRHVPRVDGVALCSVVPELDRPLASALCRLTGRPVLSVRHTCRFPFRLRVVDPARLGTDRLCAAAGAVGPRRAGAIIVDIGSALTVDLVFDGEFRGGLIMPGPGLGLWALGRYAKRLPEIDFRRLGSSSPGRFDDTRPSMILGARTAVRGAVVEGIRVLRRACGASPTVFVTGGGGGALGPRLPRGWKRDPHLVGRGLYRVWVLNATRQKKA